MSPGIISNTITTNHHTDSVKYFQHGPSAQSFQNKMQLGSYNRYSTDHYALGAQYLHHQRLRQNQSAAVHYDTDSSPMNNNRFSPAAFKSKRSNMLPNIIPIKQQFSIIMHGEKRKIRVLDDQAHRTFLPSPGSTNKAMKVDMMIQGRSSR